MGEIELLYPVLDDKETVLSKLNEFEFVGKEIVEDMYFYVKNNSSKNSETFRIRKKGSKNMMTHKIDRFDENGKWIYSDETEIEVSNFEDAKKIIERLGLKHKITVFVIKHIFNYMDYEIVLEEVDKLGLFIEVELKKVPKNVDVKDKREKIIEFIKSLNLELGEEPEFGKPELLERKLDVGKVN